MIKYISQYNLESEVMGLPQEDVRNESRGVVLRDEMVGSDDPLFLLLQRMNLL